MVVERTADGSDLRKQSFLRKQLRGMEALVGL
jgi:hypothetical protein